jgi:hypothetical protein
MGFTRLAAANPAVTNRFVTTTNMKVGAYTVANATMPTTPGARRVTVTHTSVTGDDTLGTITVTGTDIRGAVISDVIVPLAGTVATSAKFFVTVTDVVGAGWVINVGNDTIVVGAEAGSTVLDGTGTLQAIVVNTTAAGTITVTTNAGTLATLASSIAVGTYTYDTDVTRLTLTLAAASDVTVIHSGNLPTTIA